MKSFNNLTAMALLFQNATYWWHALIARRAADSYKPISGKTEPHGNARKNGEDKPGDRRVASRIDNDAKEQAGTNADARPNHDVIDGAAASEAVQHENAEYPERQADHCAPQTDEAGSFKNTSLPIQVDRTVVMTIDAVIDRGQDRHDKTNNARG